MQTIDISNLIDQHAHNNAAKPAIIFPDQQQTFTYKQLYDQVITLAGYFQANNFSNSKLAMYLPNSPEQICIYLACFKTATTVIPLNYRYKAAEIIHVLDHCDAQYLIAHEEKLDEINQIDFSQTNIKTIYIVGDDHARHPASFINFATCLAHSNNFDPSFPKTNDLTVVFYTSGSTGEPKGVMHSTETTASVFVNAIDAVSLNQHSKFLLCESASHMGTFLSSFSNLAIGGTTILLKTFTCESYLAAISKYKPTLIIALVPKFIELINHPNTSKVDFSLLKICYTGGNKVPESLQQRFKKLTGVPLCQGYGMTEAGHVTINPNPPTEKYHSIGKAVKHVQIKLVDHNQNEVGINEDGEMWVKSSANMIGYWQNPQATAENLVDGWLRTGDLVSLDADGYYWFKARIKQIIIRGGSNIVPQEVEEVFYQHPSVKAVGVVGIADPTFGEVPKAYVVLKSQQPITAEELIAFVRQKIAAYKVPEIIEIINELPLTAVGKLDRKALTKLANK